MFPSWAQQVPPVSMPGTCLFSSFSAAGEMEMEGAVWSASWCRINACGTDVMWKFYLGPEPGEKLGVES